MFSFGVILLEMLLFLNLTWCQRDTDRLTQFLDHQMATTTQDEHCSTAQWPELRDCLFDRVQELFPECVSSITCNTQYNTHPVCAAFPFISGEFAPRLGLVCPEALDLVWQLTRKDPTMRLSAHAALGHSLLG
jgi:hypothetical protein